MATAGLTVGWRPELKGKGGGGTLGVGEVQVRVLPAAILGFFVRFLALFLFLPFLSYTKQARTRIFVYICPVCINALGLCELRHDLVCITMPLVCTNPYCDLVCNKCP